MRNDASLLQVEKLTKVFGSDRTLVRAVSEVDLTANASEVTLVMGPSGSGKTTLLSMIGGLLRPTSGRVLIEDLDITALRQRELTHVRRHLVGFVFQTFNLLEALSAVENVEIALNVAGITGSEARSRASGLLVEAGLRERLHFNARDLSAGEKQRVAIARALANGPRLLLADEPTANLDSESGHEVMGLLRDLTREKGSSAVVVSHDERLREIADQLLWLEDGSIRTAGLSITPPASARMDAAEYPKYAGQLSLMNDRPVSARLEPCKRVW
ncbi:MAG: ABC transporter ATP-binding protein [Gaiellaceae bacterium]